MAFDKLPDGCEIPKDVPDIQVPDLCELPEIPAAKSFSPTVVRLPPLPPAPNVDCVDVDISIKAEDCLGRDVEIPGSFGVPDGGDCMDGRYEMKVDMPCSLMGPIMGYVSSDSADGPGSHRVSDAQTLDGEPVDTSGLYAVPLNGSAGVAGRMQVLVFYGGSRTIPARKCC